MINLHVHSMYSLRDSIIKPDDLVSRLKGIGQDAVAITDHGSSLGGISIYKTLKKNGIKYIHGCEFYICEDTSVKDKNNRYYHLVALCKNDAGRRNLTKLISISEHTDNKYYKPRIDFKMLREYGDGLIILSACMAGEISRYFESGDDEKACEVATQYREIFGEDYYLEIQSHSDTTQIQINRKIAKLAESLDIECVVTSDAHYVVEEDRKYQNKYAFNGAYKEDGEAYIDCFIQSEDEVRQRLQYFESIFVDRVIRNTHIIADKCNVEMPLSAPIMPHINTPPEFKNNKQWLEKLCAEGFQRKLGIELSDAPFLDDDQMIYVDRYHYELDSLDRMGFIDYILLVYSYANVAKRRGIARGSGGGSLVCYLTNITNIDPIEHGLYFERFIDVGALDLLASGEITANELKIPDIDLDFSGESCKEVLRFLYETYGEDRVASIGKFGTNQSKGSIRDMCRVLGIDLETADKIAKSFESYEIEEIDSMINGDIEAPRGAEEAIRHVMIYTELFDYVRKLNGLPKSFGLHACGKVISTRELDEFLPSCYDSDGVRYLQGDMHDVEDVGLVKIDVLGLRTLDQEYDTLDLSGESIEFINPKQDYSDSKVLDIFRHGDTVGIFQMSSFGMRQTLKKMDVSGIEDISIANALYRPGAMAYIDNFCRRRKKQESFEYLHPDLEEILKNTYGIIVFQEQLIEIGRLAGIHNPDLLRKATGKKDIKLLNEVKPDLESKLKARGWNDNQFEQLWLDMIDFAKYSFNKSHASAYAIIAYMTAKQKAYYPAEFFAGLCNSYIGKSSYVKDNADETITDLHKHKVKLTPFSFRNDHRRCTVNNGFIRYAIPLIKECSVSMADVLYGLKDKEYQYFWNLLKDLNNTGINKTQIKILIQLGFFSEFGNSKMLLRIKDIYEFFKCGESKSIKKEKLDEGEFLYKVVSENSSSRNAKGEELKSFKITNMENVLNSCEEYIRSFGIEDFDFKNKIATQKEYLGFVSLTTDKEEDRPKLFIKDVFPVKRKKDGVQFGYSIVAQSIGSGKETRYTIFNAVYNNDPINKEDIILCKEYERNGQYFTLKKYEKVVA